MGAHAITNLSRAIMFCVQRDYQRLSCKCRAFKLTALFLRVAQRFRPAKIIVRHLQALGSGVKWNDVGPRNNTIKPFMPFHNTSAWNVSRKSSYRHLFCEPKLNPKKEFRFPTGINIY